MFSHFRTIFKRTFLAGLLVFFPIFGTLWLLKVIILTADDFFRDMIPARFHVEQVLGFYIPGTGLLATLILILLTGLLTRLYLGNEVIKLGEWLLSKIPFGRVIYSALKQLVGTILQQNHTQFRRTVLIEFPRKGCWMLGFLTGPCPEEICAKAGCKVVYVFCPTTPNPTTGYLFMIPENEVVPVDIPTEEAFKTIVSGGLVR